ncbi:hypothetical protein [Roseateles sp.]|uniref:hypothetical protein n=1 Tax=Roseateles sp. TaxID=1971397 RepID=UPI003D10705E
MRIQATPSTAAPRAHTQPQTALDAEEASSGCGWFDSSYELSQGLVVTEDTDTCLLQLWAQALQISRVCH